MFLTYLVYIYTISYGFVYMYYFLTSSSSCMNILTQSPTNLKSSIKVRLTYVWRCFQMQAYYTTYNDLLKENLPKIYDHFNSTTLSPDLYLLDYIYTVFTKAMSLDLACRVWDVFLRDGEQFLFRTALGNLIVMFVYCI